MESSFSNRSPHFDRLHYPHIAYPPFLITRCSFFLRCSWLGTGWPTLTSNAPLGRFRC